MTQIHMMLPVWLVASLTLAACGSEAPKPVVEEPAAPAIFPAGQWEVTTLTESLKSADGAAPGTIHHAGATTVAKVCAAPGPKPDPALFVETGDKCDTTTAYAKNGRVNLAYQCNRAGKGKVAATIDGKYSTDTFEVVTAIGSYFSGSGDYSMTQRLTGKRLGDCAASAKAAG